MKLHPHDFRLHELVESLGAGDARVLQHVLFCSGCLDRLRALLRESPLTTPPAESSNIVPLDRWIAASRACGTGPDSARFAALHESVERERTEAAHLVAELLALPEERRRLIGRNQARFHTWGVCEQLLDRSREANFASAASGEALATLAIELLGKIDGTRYGLERVEDLRARAWSHLGNSRRILSRLDEAEVAFEQASEHLRLGTGEPMERAVLLDLRASLLRDQRRFEEALRCLRRAVSTFRELGETHRAGRSMIGMALLLEVMGESEGAIQLLQEALELVEPDREPRLITSAWHNLVFILAGMGRHLEAHKLLLQARPIFQRPPEPWEVNPRRWLEARIARGLGHPRQAEDHYLAARDGFLRDQTPFDVALVSLEGFATLYLEQGRYEEVRRITRAAMQVFTARRIHREALAAFLFWKEAVEADQVETGMAVAVARFLKRSRHDPSLRFERPGEPAS